VRAIDKGKEPQELTEYRRKKGASYDGPLFTVVKESIRQQLLREQGWLCAYCMRRIGGGFGQMKIEHWHCQKNYISEQLDYQNILGVCPGNEGQARGSQTCDTRKADSDIKYNPSNPSDRIEGQIHFNGDGKIWSDDAEFDGQLNEVLNLNYSRLQANRKAVLTGVLKVLSRKSGTRTPVEIERLLDQWSVANKEGYLREYCAVAIYYLRKKLNRTTHRVY